MAKRRVQNTSAKGSRAEHRDCRRCGEGFKPFGRQHVYCSRRCRVIENGQRQRRAQRIRNPQLRLRVAPPHYTGAANPGWRGGKRKWICQFCGVEFQAYLKSEGLPRRFCSWACANSAHARGADDMRSRLRFENSLIDELHALGWMCLRSAGSRGPVDVFAFNAKELRLIQVKSTNDPLRPSSVHMFVDAVQDLHQLPKPPNSSRWLYIWVLRGGWIHVDVDQLPIANRDGIRRGLRERIERWQIEAA